MSTNPQELAETLNNTQIKPKHPGGRPTKYTAHVLRKTKEYVNGEYNTVPTIAGLAVHLGVCRDIIYDWIEDESKLEFSDIVKQIKDMREVRLIDQGLLGAYNATVTKLILTTHHGYSENNQADSGVTINIDRSCGQDTVTVSKGEQSVTIDQDTTV